MPKFFINFRNGDKIMKDLDGIDAPSLDKAREAALKSVRELVTENIRSNSDQPVLAAIITDESGKELLTISAKEVLPQPLSLGAAPLPTR
jgi:hypothetical protein